MRALQILIGFSWIVFWIYWIASAFSSKPNAHGGRLGSFWPRLLILIGALIFFSIPHVNRPDWAREISGGRLWLRIIGVLLVYLGLGLAIWARRNLGRNWGMPMTLKKDPQLVTSGPYAAIRHPIYSGILLAALGTVFVESIVWLVVFIVACGYFTYSAFQEDKLMTKQFPKTYPAYKARTKMLIPYIF